MWTHQPAAAKEEDQIDIYLSWMQMFQLSFMCVAELHICSPWCNYVVCALILLTKVVRMHSHNKMLIALGSLNSVIHCSMQSCLCRGGDSSLHIPENLSWLAAWKRCGVRMLSGCFVYGSIHVQQSGFNVQWRGKASTLSYVCSVQAAVWNTLACIRSTSAMDL